jgi:hypothetical protein
MEDKETPRMREYGVSKMTQITMATVRHMTSSQDLENFKALDFCWTEGTTVHPDNSTPHQIMSTHNSLPWQQ